MTTASILRITSSSALAVLVAAILPLAPKAFADSIWNGAGADNHWTTAANWGGAAPAPGAVLQFAGSTQTTTNNNFATGTAFAGITFNAGAAPFTLGGNAITFNFTSSNGTAIRNLSANNQTINLVISLVGSKDINLDPGAGRTLTLNGVVNFGGHLFYDGVGNAGTIVFNGANTGLGGAKLFYQTTGAMMRNTVYNATNDMTYVVGNKNAFGSSAATGLQMNHNTRLESNTDLTGSNALANSIAIGGGKTLTIQGAHNLEISGNLFNSNNHGGGNTLSVTNAGITKVSGSVYLSSGGNTRAMTFDVASTLELGGTIADAYASDTGTGGLTKTGTGTLTLSGASNYRGSTSVVAGTLVYNGAVLATTGNVTVNSGATLTIGSGGVTTSSSVAAGRILIASGATLNGAGTLVLADTATSLTSVSVSGAFFPGVNGAIGTFTLNAAAAQRSAWSFEGGATLQFALGAGVTSGQMAIMGDASFPSIFFNENTINFTDLTGGNLSTGDYLLFAGDANTKYDGLVTGAGYAGSSVTGKAILGGLKVGTGLTGYDNVRLFLVGNAIYLHIEAKAIPEPSGYAEQRMFGK